MKFDPLKKVGTKKTVQGNLFCTACQGTGEYINKPNIGGKVTKMICPLCKGTGKPTFKGKIFLNK